MITSTKKGFALAALLVATGSIVVETREGTTTTLMRMDAMALANLTDGEVQLQSE